MEKYSVILFDFDGTLVDLQGFINQYTEEFLREHNLSVDKPLPELYREINSGESQLGSSLVDQFKQGFRQKILTDIQLIDDVTETLKELKEKHRLGIVSTGYLERLKKILEAKNIIGYFDVFIGREDVTNQKPHPEPILTALNRLKASTEKTLYVGDAQVDIEAGKAAGVDTAFFAANQAYADYLKDWLKENKPTHIVENFKDLLKITT